VLHSVVPKTTVPHYPPRWARLPDINVRSLELRMDSWCNYYWSCNLCSVHVDQTVKYSDVIEHLRTEWVPSVYSLAHHQPFMYWIAFAGTVSLNLKMVNISSVTVGWDRKTLIPASYFWTSRYIIVSQARVARMELTGCSPSEASRVTLEPIVTNCSTEASDCSWLYRVLTWDCSHISSNRRNDGHGINNPVKGVHMIEVPCVGRDTGIAAVPLLP
jgi:hypothetical protein